MSLSDKRKDLLKLLEVYLNGEQADIILRKVKEQDKEAVKELKKWLELHQDTLITGGTVWEVIKEEVGEKLI